MAKGSMTSNLKSALRRKKAQERRYASLSVSEKLRLIDQLHSNAAFLKSLKPKASMISKSR